MPNFRLDKRVWIPILIFLVVKISVISGGKEIVAIDTNNGHDSTSGVPYQVWCLSIAQVRKALNNQQRHTDVNGRGEKSKECLVADYKRLALPEMWKRFQENTNDVQTRNALVEHYLPIVRHVAMQMAGTVPPCVEMDDLTSEGVFGLMGALKGYDPGREFKFETYCVPRIRGAMLDFLRRIDHVPRCVRSKMNGRRKAADQLRVKLGREPTDGEVARAMDMDMETYERITAEIQGFDSPMSLDEKRRETDSAKDLCLKNAMEDPRAPDPANNGETTKEFWGQMCIGLTSQERTLVHLYYREHKTMKEIGVEMGLSEARMSQVHLQAIGHMRRRCQAHCGRGDYLDWILKDHALLTVDKEG